jgi:hypothetical protein
VLPGVTPVLGRALASQILEVGALIGLLVGGVFGRRVYTAVYAVALKWAVPGTV